MSGDSRYFKLGLFVIIGVMLLVAGVVIFGAGALFQDYVTVETATTSSVEGLDVGAAVKYNGVPIGRVSKIEMASWRYHEQDPAAATQTRRYIVIEMSIRRELLQARTARELRENLAEAVKNGLRARMASSGLTGPALIEVSYLDPQAYPVQPLPWAPRELYVPSAPSSMTQIVSSVEQIMSKLRDADIQQVIADARTLINDTDAKVKQVDAEQISERATALLDEVRASNRRVKEILDNPKLDQTINDLADAVASGKQKISSDDAKSFISDLPKISARMRDTMEQIDQIVHDPKVQQILTNVNRTTAVAAPAAADMRRLVIKVNQLLTTQRQDLEAIIVSLRRVLDNTSDVVEDAKSNPSRLLFGQPPPRYENGAKP